MLEDVEDDPETSGLEKIVGKLWSRFHLGRQQLSGQDLQIVENPEEDFQNSISNNRTKHKINNTTHQLK
jgi:hypothetical protein